VTGAVTDAVTDSVVVVGAGAAGLTAVETLRGAGFSGRIDLVGAEPHLPYDRPPLSKQVLTGGRAPEDLVLRPAADYPELDARLHLGDPAVALDRTRREVVCASGAALSFDGLVLATGVGARRLSQVPDSADVAYLRTLDDAVRLRRRLAERPRTVVIGAGFLGVEVAVAARQLGCDVTVVDPLPEPMLRQFGPLIGGVVRRRHEGLGVRFRLGVGVTAVVADGSASSVVGLADGSVLVAGLVVVAVGSTPSVDWLAGTGLADAGGVPCDARCRADEGIYVAGDIAVWTDPVSGVRQRFEHRMNASEQGRCAALNLLGEGEVLRPSRYFWSDQGDLRIQAAGEFPTTGTVELVDGHPDDDRFIAVCTADGRMTGALGWNSPRRFTRWRAQVGEALEPSGGASAFPLPCEQTEKSA
jgi:3-phenylpropionate/trans-cinnamate dioxygenase ferredoxin reductase component